MWGWPKILIALLQNLRFGFLNMGARFIAWSKRRTFCIGKIILFQENQSVEKQIYLLFQSLYNIYIYHYLFIFCEDFQSETLTIIVFFCMYLYMLVGRNMCRVLLFEKSKCNFWFERLVYICVCWELKYKNLYKDTQIFVRGY